MVDQGGFQLLRDQPLVFHDENRERSVSPGFAGVRRGRRSILRRKFQLQGRRLLSPERRLETQGQKFGEQFRHGPQTPSRARRRDRGRRKRPMFPDDRKWEAGDRTRRRDRARRDALPAKRRAAPRRTGRSPRLIEARGASMRRRRHGSPGFCSLKEDLAKVSRARRPSSGPAPACSLRRPSRTFLRPVRPSPDRSAGRRPATAPSATRVFRVHRDLRSGPSSRVRNPAATAAGPGSPVRIQ